jgi:Domain of unknown function (DUF4153)
MPALPFILLAAVIQGWSLYGLHHSLEFHHWPATNQGWLMALYALAVFVPLTVQMLADHARGAPMWRLVAILAAGYFYFGWHHGAAVFPGGPELFRGADEYFPFALVLIVLWLMALPFAQVRLATGRWAIQYPALFANAWRNKLTLAEAGLFTALFWLLLFLWQMLFHMLGIDYFRELFREPIFVYPVTSLTFGCALHLIGSIERLTAVVLEQLLNVLKWLGLLAGAILVLFTVALVFKLPGLVFTGQKAIGAAWLLWLIAVVVLLLNAAYRDGSVPQPYPKWMAQFLRLAVPLTVIVSLTAIYALSMRSRQYGLTVERIWGFVVAGAALLYSAGYSIAALGRGAWLAGMSRVNVAVAIALIAVLSAALTPLLSPYRLAADSQFRLIRAKGLAVMDDKHPKGIAFTQNSPLQYLRFDSGRYGLVKLQELADSPMGIDADGVRQAAKRLLAQKNRWEFQPASDTAVVLGKLHTYPAGRTLDQDLKDKLITDLAKPENRFSFQDLSEERVVGIYIDLAGSGADDFVLLTANHGLVYEHREAGWALVADANPSFIGPQWKSGLLDELAKGNVSTAAPKWKELTIGSRTFRVSGRREGRAVVMPPTLLPQE